MPYCAACGKEITWGNFCPYCAKPTGYSYVLPYSSPQPATVAGRTSSAPARWVLICACVGAASMCAVAVASFLPWIGYSGITIGGLHRDGKLVLVLGLLGVAFAFAAAVLNSRWPFPVLIVLGVIVAAVTSTDILDVTRTVGLSLSNVGVGLFLGAAAGVIAVVAGATGSSLLSLPR